MLWYNFTVFWQSHGCFSLSKWKKYSENFFVDKSALVFTFEQSFDIALWRAVSVAAVSKQVEPDITNFKKSKVSWNRSNWLSINKSVHSCSQQIEILSFESEFTDLDSLWFKKKSKLFIAFKIALFGVFKRAHYGNG